MRAALCLKPVARPRGRDASRGPDRPVRRAASLWLRETLMLDLEFTHEQDMLRDMVRGLCSEFSPLERVRELEDDPDGIARDLWRRFGELGLCGPDGLRERGRLGHEPHRRGCALRGAGALPGAAPPLRELRAGRGCHRGSRHPLPAGRAAGRHSVGRHHRHVAWLEPGGGYKPRGVQLAARADGDGFVLDGSKAHVPFTAAADLLVVLARTGDGDADIDLFVVPADASGLSIEQRMSISSDTQHLVTFDCVPVPGSARLGAPDSEAGTGWSAWQRTMHAGAILAAAQAVGGAVYALEITVGIRQDETPVRQGPGRVPSHLALPGRRPHRPRRRPAADVRGGLGPQHRPLHRAPGSHGQAVRLPHLSRHHGHMPASVRRDRLHS